MLERYRDQLLTFNDDIQGTAAVALGAILGAISVTGGKLPDQRIVFLGAGSAGIGVADYLRAALVVGRPLRGRGAARASGSWTSSGCSRTAAPISSPSRRVYAQPAAAVADWPRSAAGQIDLAQVVGEVHPTILIGLSTVHGAFTEAIVREMARKSTGRSSSRSPTRRATARRRRRT